MPNATALKLQIVQGKNCSLRLARLWKIHRFGDSTEPPSREKFPLLRGCVDSNHPDDHYCSNCIEEDASGSIILLLGFRDVNWGGARF